MFTVLHKLCTAPPNCTYLVQLKSNWVGFTKVNNVLEKRFFSSRVDSLAFSGERERERVYDRVEEAEWFGHLCLMCTKVFVCVRSFTGT